jgi:hypothetical protein
MPSGSVAPVSDDGLVIRLLDTTADDVPSGLRTELAAACEPVLEISAAYVARTSYRFESEDLGYESLNFALELATSHSGDAAREDEVRVGDQLFERLQWSIARTGCALPVAGRDGRLAERGVRVFDRAASDDRQR